jgi:signal transduction histidine kinase
MLHFQTVDDLLAPGEAKDALEKVLDRADKAILEGRSAIQNLRSSTTLTSELAQAIAALGEEFSGTHTGESVLAKLSVSVEGSPREIHPILRDDIYRIAREAMGNAFRHAQASKIEAEITYGARFLRLRIRDDGKGINRKLLDAGRDGHWGLAGTLTHFPLSTISAFLIQYLVSLKTAASTRTSGASDTNPKAPSSIFIN